MLDQFFERHPFMIVRKLFECRSYVTFCQLGAAYVPLRFTHKYEQTRSFDLTRIVTWVMITIVCRSVTRVFPNFRDLSCIPELSTFSLLLYISSRSDGSADGFFSFLAIADSRAIGRYCKNIIKLQKCDSCWMW